MRFDHHVTIAPPSSPLLFPSPREGTVAQGKGEERLKKWKREVRLYPTGLVSVRVNQEVRMWQQGRHNRDDCVRVCVCVLLDWGVVHVKITARSYTGDQGWCSEWLSCRRRLCCDLLWVLCVCVWGLLKSPTTSGVRQCKCSKVCRLLRRKTVTLSHPVWQKLNVLVTPIWILRSIKSEQSWYMFECKRTYISMCKSHKIEQSC